MDYKQFWKNHQQAIVLILGFLAVGGLGFGLGKFTAFKYSAPAIKVEEAFAPPGNYTATVSGIQSDATAAASTTAVNQAGSGQLDCTGKIKATSSMIYHLPGDAFYDRTTKPIACFDTEAQAQAAGFRKSSK